MSQRIKYLPILIGAISSSSYAASYSIEARGDAMGGVGVVAATYLTAPFYNPALTAIYRRNDDAGMLLPSFGLTYNDPDNIVDSFDALATAIEQSDATRAAAEMDKLSGKELKAEIGAAVAIGIPNSYVSMNAFGKSYAETYVVPDIIDGDPEGSSVNAVSVAVLEAGLSLAKYSHYLGQHIAIGISPKLQRVNTYVYNASFEDYSIYDVAENSNGETVFNIDTGAIWFYGPIRIGFSAMNLVARDIETKANPVTLQTYKYALKPQYTVGAGLVADYATLSVDYDLVEETRFSDFDDNTQYIRVGGEIDLMRQLKLRAGYKKNLAYDDSEPTYTAGLGISPLGLLELDIAVSYTNPHAKGAYVNFLTTF